MFRKITVWYVIVTIFTTACVRPFEKAIPSGFGASARPWVCSGTANCAEWIQTSLDHLQKSGPVGYRVWAAFMRYAEERRAARCGCQVSFHLNPGGGASGGAWAFDSNPSITLNEGYWTRDAGDFGVVGAIAHEIVHLLQGHEIAVSLQGELAAYEIEYQVQVALGDDQPAQYSFLGDLHAFVVEHDANIAGLTDAEIGELRTLILHWTNNNLGYSLAPARPFGTTGGLVRWFAGATIERALTPELLLTDGTQS